MSSHSIVYLDIDDISKANYIEAMLKLLHKEKFLIEAYKRKSSNNKLHYKLKFKIFCEEKYFLKAYNFMLRFIFYDDKGRIRNDSIRFMMKCKENEIDWLADFKNGKEVGKWKKLI